MNCTDVKEKYSDYIDCCLGECQGEVEAHLAICPVCRRELGSLRRMVSALNCLPQAEVPRDFLVHVNNRLDESRQGWFARWSEAMSEAFPSRALAMAATVALVVLAVFYLNTHKADVPGAGGVVASRVKGISATGSQSVPTVPRTPEELAVADRVPEDTGLVHSVALTSTPIERPVVSYPLSENVQAPSSIKLPYVDKIVILKASNPSVAAAQVRRAATNLSSSHKDYSETIIYVLSSADNADLFLQALETIGSTEVISGPIEQGLPILLFQVIVIPNR